MVLYWFCYQLVTCLGVGHGIHLDCIVLLSTNELDVMPSATRNKITTPTELNLDNKERSCHTKSPRGRVGSSGCHTIRSWTWGGCQHCHHMQTEHCPDDDREHLSSLPESPMSEETFPRRHKTPLLRTSFWMSLARLSCVHLTDSHCERRWDYLDWFRPKGTTL